MFVMFHCRQKCLAYGEQPTAPFNFLLKSEQNFTERENGLFNI